MSALLSIGEANHLLLNADAEIGFAATGTAVVSAGVVVDPDPIAALTRARQQLTEARAVLAAVRLALRTQAIADALEYHREMAVRLREGAIRSRMLPGRGLHAGADRHEAFAKALRALIGTPQTGFSAHVLIDEVPLPRRPIGEKGPHAS